MQATASGAFPMAALQSLSAKVLLSISVLLQSGTLLTPLTLRISSSIFILILLPPCHELSAEGLLKASVDLVNSHLPAGVSGAKAVLVLITLAVCLYFERRYADKKVSYNDGTFSEVDR